MSDYYEIVTGIIESVTDIPKEEIEVDSPLIDGLDLSSLEIMTIISNISRMTSIPISINDVLGIQTVSDIVAVLEAHSQKES